MYDTKSLISESSADAAFKDTLTDEYYSDITQEGIKATYASLAQNPFPGLRPFKTSESLVFFGREGISTEIITRLSRHRFLAVLGASGTGKSSLVRAGLLPSLSTLPGRHGTWKVAICRPGKNPFGNFVQAISLAKMAPGQSLLDLWKVVSGSSYGFENLLQSIAVKETYNTLIIIDQFEELFRYRKDKGIAGKNDASLFVKMLIDISRNSALNCYVMITMRSEYLGDCVQMPDLADAINEGQYLVPRLKPEQLADAITEPMMFTGAEMEAAFENKLIGEIGDNMDQLPVLQHALRRTYERAKKRAQPGGTVVVTYKDYLEEGRLHEALDKHANEIYKGMSTPDKQYTRIIFQCITDKASDGRGIRRPFSFAIITAICAEQVGIPASNENLRKSIESIINIFREDSVNFLMPPPHVPMADELEIDISHESLMRVWNELKKWITDEAVDANLLKELLKRESTEYLKGSKLTAYTEWLELKKPGIAWATMYKPADLSDEEYSSGFNAGLLLIHESQRKQKQKRVTRIAIIGSVFLLISAFGLVYFLKNKELDTANAELNTSKKRIQYQYDSLRRQQYSLDSSRQAIDKINIRLNVKNDSLENANGEIERKKSELQIEVKKRQDALSKLDRTYHSLYASQNELKKQSDQQLLFIDSLKITKSNLERAKDSAKNLKNLALAIKYAEKSMGIPIMDETRERIKTSLALIAYDSLQQSGNTERNRFQPIVYAALYDALKSKNSTGVADLRNITNYLPGSDHVAFASVNNSVSPNDIYLTAEDNYLYNFSINSNSSQAAANRSRAATKIVGIEGSPGGKWQALMTLDTVFLLKDNIGKQEYQLHFPRITRAVSFSPDASRLYSFANDSTIYVTDLQFAAPGGKPASVKLGKVPYKLESMAISNNYLYGVTKKGELIRWNRKNITDTAKLFSPTRDQMSRGTKIICKPDDGLIVWGNEKGQTFYLTNEKNSSYKYLTKFTGSVSDIHLNNTETLMAISSFDKTIRVYKLPNLVAEAPILLTDNPGPVTSIFFTSPDVLAAVVSPGAVKLYELSLDKLAVLLRNNSRGMSDDEKKLYLEQ